MKIIGHRGARGLAPENTLRSFAAALEHGADELEFDLRVTKDGIVVLHHDPEVRGLGDEKLCIRDCDYEELVQHKPDLLTFKDFIREIGTQAHLLIEIKPREPTEPILELIGQQLKVNAWEPSDLSIGSFDQHILRVMHQKLPQVEMVVNEKWSGIRAHLRAKELGTHRLNMRSWWLWTGFLKSMYRRGYRIAPYTLNDPAKIQKWQPYLYGVITDYPDRFKP